MHVFGSGTQSEEEPLDTPFEGSGSSLSSFNPEPEYNRRKGKKRRKEVKDSESEPKKPTIDAFSRIVALCSVRDRSEHELAERLERDGYDMEEVQSSIQRAVDCGLVDDMRFAEAFVRGRVSAGKGEVVIRRDLEQHGISVEQLPGWPEQFDMDHEHQVQRALHLLESNPPRAKDTYNAAFRKLVTKGYPKAVATRAVRMWHNS